MSRDATTPLAFASARSDTTTPSQSLGQSLRSFGEQLLIHEVSCIIHTHVRKQT